MAAVIYRGVFRVCWPALPYINIALSRFVIAAHMMGSFVSHSCPGRRRKKCGTSMLGIGCQLADEKLQNRVFVSALTTPSTDHRILIFTEVSDLLHERLFLVRETRKLFLQLYDTHVDDMTDEC